MKVSSVCLCYSICEVGADSFNGLFPLSIIEVEARARCMDEVASPCLLERALEREDYVGGT